MISIYRAISRVAISINSICILLLRDQGKYSPFSPTYWIYRLPEYFGYRAPWNFEEQVSRECFIIARQLRIGETVNEEPVGYRVKWSMPPRSRASLRSFDSIPPIPRRESTACWGNILNSNEARGLIDENVECGLKVILANGGGFNVFIISPLSLFERSTTKL